MPEDIRDKLIKFWSRIRSKLAQYTHDRNEQYELEKYYMSFSIYRGKCVILYFSPKPENVFPRDFNNTEGSLMAWESNSFISRVNHLD